MSDSITRLTHGTSGLVLAYVLALTGIVLGLIRSRAPWERAVMAPVIALPATLGGVIASALVSSLPKAFGLNAIVLQLGLGLTCIVAVGYATGIVWVARGRSHAPAYRRGAVIAETQTEAIEEREGRRWGRREESGRTAVTVAGVRVRIEDETKHFKIVGTTGTGKSTAIREILGAALERGDRAIIADPDGGYLNRFYDPARGDVILNPFDPDARKWDFFGEIVNDYDIEQLARSLIPDGGASERIWPEYARTFVTEVIRQMIRAGNRSDREVLRLLTSAPGEELRMLLSGTPAGPFLDVGNEKMFGSIRSVATSAVRALDHTTKQEARLFSVRQWVRDGAAKQAGGAGCVLFLPYRAGEIAALRSMISAWMRLGIFEAMDRDEADQRLWFVIDELDALGEIDGLKDALARLRKFGGRCVLGFQSIAQVSGSYGRAAAETIVENCGNTLILRCSASEHGGTAEFASKLIGQREMLHTTLSRTRAPGAWRSSTTTSQHLKVESAVMASEIERLPDLAGFLKLASVADWQFVRLTRGTETEGVRRRRPVVATSQAPTNTAPRAGEPPPERRESKPDRKKGARGQRRSERVKSEGAAPPRKRGSGLTPPPGAKPKTGDGPPEETTDDARSEH